MKKKHGQITAFILIGIVILGIFVAVIVTRNKLKPATPPQQPQQGADIKVYVQQCVDDALGEGVRLISRQGGFIFKEQNFSSIHFDVPKAPYLGDNVSIISYPSQTAFNNYYYPCQLYVASNNTLLDRCYRNYEHTQPYFQYGGIGRGPDSNILPELCRNSSGIFKVDCTARYAETTIQDQLQEYIANYTSHCLSNLSVFNELGYTLERSNITAQVLFGNNRVRADIHYNISASSQGAKSTSGLFSTELPVRTKVFYQDVILPALQRDNMDITHNLSKGLKDRILNLSVSNVSLTEAQLADGTRIIRITDTARKIRGQEYYYQVAVANRQPALDYFRLPNPRQSDYDIYVTKGTKIVVTPVAYDPDEQPLTFSYTGWQADYNEYYNTSDNTWRNITPITNRWETSAPYATTGCTIPGQGHRMRTCAEFTTGDHDIGYHEFNITVADNFGLEDSQVVRVYVTETPVANLLAASRYADIAFWNVSNEDPFQINVTATGVADPAFMLSYPDDPALLALNKPWTHITLPPILLSVDVTGAIETIAHGMALGEHRLIGGVQKYLGTPLEQGNDTRQLTVLQCLPHRNETPIYPYNNLPWSGLPRTIDPFQANHTCCKDDGSYQLASTPCFAWEDYGSLNDMISGKTLDVGSAIGTTDDIDVTWQSGGTAGKVSAIKGWPNSSKLLFNRTYSRSCDGSRGNICNGTVTYTLKIMEECGVCEEPVWGYPTCMPKPAGTVCGVPMCSRRTALPPSGSIDYNITIGNGNVITRGICAGNTCVGDPSLNNDCDVSSQVCYPNEDYCR